MTHLMHTYPVPEVTFVRGSGSELFDDTGKRYLDFLCGLAVTGLGHAHPAVTAAVGEQAGRLVHVSNLFGNEHAPALAADLDRLIGGPGGRVFFANSGAEANECALKLARKWGGHGRHGVVTLYASFHGRTMATLAATGQPSKHEPFQPLPEGFRHVALGDLDALTHAVDPTVAAVMVEPVQAEGGVNPLPDDYLRSVRQLCDERGMLLILDEIQAGMGRTGAWFGFQHADVVADVVTMAKGLGNGMPIGACWARDDVADAFTPGDHGSTFGGQPLATAAARATVAALEEIDAPARSAAVGADLARRLDGLDGVEAVRGRGLLLAAELTADALAGRTAGDVARACLHAGLVCNGVTPTALRFTPPLTVAEAEVDEALSILAGVLAEST